MHPETLYWPGSMTDLKTFGRQLENARKGMELTRADLAQELNIPESHIASLEAGRLVKGIDPVFQKGFARTLAAHLGIDPAGASQAFGAVSSDNLRFNKIHMPAKLHDSHIPARSLMLAAVSALIMTVGGWFYLDSDDSRQASTVPPVPDHLTRLLSMEEAPAVEATDSEALDIQPAIGDATLSLTALEAVDLRILENRGEVWSGHMNRGEQREWPAHADTLVVAEHPEAITALLRADDGSLLAETPVVLTETEYRALLQKRAAR